MSQVHTSIKKMFLGFCFFSVIIFQFASISKAKAEINEKSILRDNITSNDKRFIDNGDGTITDTKTNLMWMKQDSYLHSGHWMHWFDAINFIKKLNQEQFADYMDWDLPTVDELRTLYEPKKFNSAQIGREMKIHIDPIFAKNGSGGHWSGEKNGIHSAFGFIYNNGEIFSHPKKSKSRKAVRAVRRLP